MHASRHGSGMTRVALASVDLACAAFYSLQISSKAIMMGRTLCGRVLIGSYQEECNRLCCTLKKDLADYQKLPGFGKR
jgi:hypothetical protein